jgi:hypothetical protein
MRESGHIVVKTMAPGAKRVTSGSIKLRRRAQPINEVRNPESERDRKVLSPQLIINPVNLPKRIWVQGRIPQVILRQQKLIIIMTEHR